MSKGPWFISEEDARERDRLVVEQYCRDFKAAHAPGRPFTALRLDMARRGYGGTELRRIEALMHKDLGHARSA